METRDPRELIEATRDGTSLTETALRDFVAGVTDGRVTDGQAAAWLMAVCCRGLSDEAAAWLTSAMAASGEQLDLSALPHTADKHSTGGVGDKTTLVACPIAAAAGCTVAKMSGRGLGHTGGTIDKLESIPGLRTDLSTDGFLRQAREVGLVVAGQTADLAPADKRLYALRNETGTTESVPLIAASVMSKKLAAGAGAIVLDVKWGSGALVAPREEALQLARLMVHIGEANGRRVAALLSPMDRPLGRAVGNLLEVREAVETLRGSGPPDLRALSLELAARMIELSGVARSPEEADGRALEALESGRALAKLLAMVRAQGGDASLLEDPARMPCATLVEPLLCTAGGWVTAVDARRVAEAVELLGGARLSREVGPDPLVGIVLERTVGEECRAGEPLAWLHANDPARLETARECLGRAITAGGEMPAKGADPGEWVAGA
jgi:pyrimidine-nucleoside phosphorylase